MDKVIERIVNAAIPLDEYANCLPKRQLAIARRWKLKQEILALLTQNVKPGPSVTK